MALVQVPATVGGLVELASGTMSGSSVVISSIPGTYKSLSLAIYGLQVSTACGIRFRVNGITTSTYLSGSTGFSGGNTMINEVSGAQDTWRLNGNTYNLNSGVDDQNFWIELPNYFSTTAYKTFNSRAGYFNASSLYSVISSFGIMDSQESSAITSLTILPSGAQTFSAGTYKLYGVA